MTMNIRACMGVNAKAIGCINWKRSISIISLMQEMLSTNDAKIGLYNSSYTTEIKSLRGVSFGIHGKA